MQHSRNIFVFVILFSVSIIGNAQKIELKKEKVLLDGKEIMKYNIVSWGSFELHLYSLETNKEVVFINKNNNETPKYYEDDFTQIKFLQLGKGVETKLDKPIKKYVQWLFDNEVIDKDGNVSADKVDLFIKNYDEKITPRTIR